MTPFQRTLRPTDIGKLVDLTVVGDPDSKSMAKMQLDGVAAIYNVLCESPVAYLADEVGMGKTYQALTLAAVLWNEKPTARILFMSPRQNVQEKWLDDYKRFFHSNYRRTQQKGDDLVTSVLFSEPIHRPQRFDNLRSWTPTTEKAERIAPFLRHTSFARPVYITKHDTADIDRLWRDIQRRVQGWGLFGMDCPEGLSPSDASRRLNLAFGRALNKKLSEAADGEPYFDLVIIDEAQCLRNPSTQGNRVLSECLQGQVAKWLFMSATPAHSGPGDILRIVNHYPDSCREIVPQGLERDLPGLQEALRKFMVRRQRRYLAKPKDSASDEIEVGKDKYRNHEAARWSVRDSDMTVLETLAMGLVQKRLVDVLLERSNRYRIGFLSSFESLQSSIDTLHHSTPMESAIDDGEKGDWHRDQADANAYEKEGEAPDTGFIRELSRDFEDWFGTPLPHPKVDSVVRRIAARSFGTDSEPGGEKVLVFTRRVSTVHTLRKRLTKLYVQAIEARMRRCWNLDFGWRRWVGGIEEPDDDDDPEAFDAEPEGDPFRRAMSKGGWLFRYRQTFRASGRNALFFEDGWLQRLCMAGRVEPKDAAEKLSNKLWAESWAHASVTSGDRRRQHRADRLRYLAVQAIRREPRIFGLDEETAEPWRAAYEACLHNHLDRERIKADADPRQDFELFTSPTLWTSWDASFRGRKLSLPAADLSKLQGGKGREDLLRRQVARTLLGQVFRLSDTILDLYFSDEGSRGSATRFLDRFLGWLSSDDPGSIQLRRDCRRWLVHLRLIVDSCLDGAGQEWDELARTETWRQIFNLRPVIGVTGGSRGHRAATRQFRMPSMPRIIVCTDTLKEGVDLHLFCDRVLHYGVAWTSGDMEQRVGRVDRFFSQIERRLKHEGLSDGVELHIGYPHVVSSLERRQVELVIARQKEAESLMDSPIAGALNEASEIVDGAGTTRLKHRKLGPFPVPDFPKAGRNVVAISAKDSETTENHYFEWYQRLLCELKRRGLKILPDGTKPVRKATLKGNRSAETRHQHELEWSFDAALRRYVLTVSNLLWPSDVTFSGGKRRCFVDRNRRIETFVRLLVPTPDEGVDGAAIDRLIEALEGTVPSPNLDARDFWGEALECLAEDGVEWLTDHKARLRVRRGARTHGITLYAYKGSVRVVGVVAPLTDLEDHPPEWDPRSGQEWGDWALHATGNLPLGYLDVHHRDGLVFGIHAHHGDLAMDARWRLVKEVAWRADMWEATLTGVDRQ